MGINIGFEVFDKINEEEMKNKEKKSSQVSNKVLKPIFIPEKRIPEFLKDYDCVVVNNFEDDDYHLTEEEKAEKNEFYKEFLKLNKCRNTVRKLPEYIDMMREAMKCLDMVAEKNGVYDPNEFKKMVLKGDIKIAGWKIPKFKGKDRKHISASYIAEFILGNEDPSNLASIQQPQYEYSTEEELLDEADYMFAEGELDRILSEPSEEAVQDWNSGFDIEDDDPTGRNIVLDQEQKNVKRTMKDFPELLIAMKNAKRASNRIDNLSSMIYSLAEDDLKNIAMYDKKLKIASESDVPEFKGNIFDDDEYHKYMMKLEEWEQSQIYEEVGGKFLNLSQIKELELKEILESSGYDLRKFYHNKKDKKLERKRIALMKKKDKQIKEKLLKLNEQKSKLKQLKYGKKKNKTMLFSDDDDIIELDDNGKPKKLKKKDIKKNRRKQKKKEKQMDKKHQECKKKAREDLDEFLLGVADQMSGDFDDYSADSLDWSWEGILNHPEDE